ncbi:MAG: hypothetical protein ABJA49_00265 [Betaproteobacteria bacterium]
MTHLQGRIVGEVSYREGDGVMLLIPLGRCEVERDDIDVTITWVDEGVHGSTAIPRGDFDSYVDSGLLVIDAL